MTCFLRSLAGAVLCRDVMRGVASMFCVAMCSVAPASADVKVYGSGGWQTPFDEDHRSRLGGAAAVGVGVSAHFSERAAVFLETGAAFNSGPDVVPDPTFETEDARFRYFPLSFGVRTDLVRREDGPLRLHLGAAWQTVFVRRKDPFSGTETGTAQGIALELLPEYRLGDWFVWARQRVLLLGNAQFDNAFDVHEPSSSMIEIGLGYRFRPASPENRS